MYQSWAGASEAICDTESICFQLSLRVSSASLPVIESGGPCCAGPVPPTDTVGLGPAPCPPFLTLSAKRCRTHIPWPCHPPPSGRLDTKIAHASCRMAGLRAWLMSLAYAGPDQCLAGRELRNARAVPISSSRVAAQRATVTAPCDSDDCAGRTW